MSEFKVGDRVRIVTDFCDVKHRGAVTTIDEILIGDDKFEYPLPFITARGGYSADEIEKVSTRLYLAGPMRGIPYFNFPAFDKAAAQLRAAGYEVWSPAEHDRTVYGEDFEKAYPTGTEDGDFDLRAALKADTTYICLQADGVALLPGWEDSAGARAEKALAEALGLFCKSVDGWIAESDAMKWTNEREDIIERFTEELRKATGDGSKKRQAGEKPPWYRDDTHFGAVFSHLTKYVRGELEDNDSGAHPLVHAAWRCLAIAAKETGNVPQ